jgi:hypothetical protein
LLFYTSDPAARRLGPEPLDRTVEREHSPRGLGVAPRFNLIWADGLDDRLAFSVKLAAAFSLASASRIWS